MKNKFKYPLSLATVVLVLDLATKILVQGGIERFESITVIPGFFDLVHVLNKGAAFGFLNSEHIAWQRPFFIAAAAIAVVSILYLIREGHGREWFGATGLGLLLGGALGNLIDRIRIGYVVDFLDIYVGDWHWPAFNVADIGISIGVTCLIISFYQVERHKGRNRKNASEDS